MISTEYRDITYVLAVFREGGFSRAAEKLHISQPALSKAVRKVEQQLGIAIFFRQTMPLRLTPDGKRILECFEQIEQAYLRLSDYCENRQSRQKRFLRVGAPSFFCTYVLPQMAEEYTWRNPKTEIKIIECNDKTLRHYLHNGVVDVGISVEELEPESFSSVELGREEIILAVPESFAVNDTLRGRELSEADFTDGGLLSENAPAVPMEAFRCERFIFLSPENAMSRLGYQLCRDAGFEPVVSMELDQLMTAYYLSEAGWGISLIRAAIPGLLGFSDQLRFYRVDHIGMQRSIWAYESRSRRSSALQRDFVSYLKHRFHSL